MRTAEMTIVAGRHFTRGQRAFFFALGYLGWFVGPWVLIVATAAVLIVDGGTPVRLGCAERPGPGVTSLSPQERGGWARLSFPAGKVDRREAAGRMGHAEGVFREAEIGLHRVVQPCIISASPNARYRAPHPSRLRRATFPYRAGDRWPAPSPSVAARTLDAGSARRFPRRSFRERTPPMPLYALDDLTPQLPGEGPATGSPRTPR